LTRGAFNFDDSFVDFRNFLLKKLSEHAGMGAGQHNLRPAAGDLHAYNVGSNPVPLAVPFPWHLLFFRENAVGPSKVDNDVAFLEALHNAIDQLSFAAFKLVVDNLPFRIADALDNVLLGGLCSDTAEHTGVQFAQELIADLGIGIKSLSSFLEG